MLVGAADPCGPKPAERYHESIYGTVPDERAAGVCGPYIQGSRTFKIAQEVQAFQQITSDQTVIVSLAAP